MHVLVNGVRLFFDVEGARLVPNLVRLERFLACGHGVIADAPERALAVIREFIAH